MTEQLEQVCRVYSNLLQPLYLSVYKPLNKMDICYLYCYEVARFLALASSPIYPCMSLNRAYVHTLSYNQGSCSREPPNCTCTAMHDLPRA